MTESSASVTQATDPAAWMDEQVFADPGARVLRNAAAMWTSNIISKGLLFLWQILLARALGAEGYGIYGTIGALLAIGAVVPDLGMGLIVIREAAKRPSQRGRYLAATLSLQPLLAASGYVLLLLVAFVLGYETTLIHLLALAAAGLLVDVFGNMAHNQLLAAERMLVPAVIGVAHVILLMALAGAALAGGGGLWGLYLALLSAGVLRSLVYWLSLRRAGIRPTFPLDLGMTRQLVLSGLPLAATAFISLASAHVDKLLTTALAGPRGTGYLTAAFVVVFGVVELLSTPWLVATLPWMSRSYGRGESHVFLSLIEKLTALSMLLGLPLAVGISLLALPLTRWLFGAAYIQTASVLQVLIWYALINMANGVFAQTLTVQDRQRWLLIARAFGLAFNLALALTLIPSLGVPGAALAALLSECAVLAQFSLLARLPAHWWRRLSDRLWRLALSGVALAATLIGLSRIHPLLAVLSALPVYLILIRASGAARRQDWRLLRRLLAVLPRSAGLQRARSEGLE